MKKLTTILFGLFLALSALAQNTNTTDTGVVINGVKWATRNVDAFGTFVDTPESTGMFYQWNRPKAWNTTDVEVTGWDATVPAGTIWEKANDPSPKGWRVPTKEEQQSLFDVEKVTNEWTTQNGITGRKFIDKATGNSLFLPAAGNRFYSPGALGYAGMRGYYWSSTPYETIGTGAYG
ncbi:MAG: fibrobacter succinogenes major paralogous domain-containing protein, partial [Bacteroidetes bacterium]|nr:fibrobacter succinogenes major paralogous domain-containing protein [Bacteroidota bacterium]